MRKILVIASLITVCFCTLMGCGKKNVNDSSTISEYSAEMEISE